MRYLFLLLLLSGCATGLQVDGPSEPTVIAQKNGRNLYEATCRRDIKGCYAEASEVCKGQYDIETTESQSRGAVHVGYGMMANINRHSMIYSCRGPSSVKP